MLSMGTLKRTLKKPITDYPKGDLVTEDRKEHPIPEYRKKDPITEDTERTQSNIDTTM